MRIVPQSMTDAWLAEDKIGNKRPVIRATIQIQNLHRFEYDTAWALGGNYGVDRHRKGYFTSMLFGDVSGPREIRNIQSCTWTRSVEQDVATCEMTILNSEITPIGNPEEVNPSDMQQVDQPGTFTFNRGLQTIAANRWGYDESTGWQGIYVPDRTVRTYEGYGKDATQKPGNDPNLMQSGVWLVNTVTYNGDGTMTLAMKDFADLLLKQICFPPVIPYEEYPLAWSKIHSAMVPGRDVHGGRWVGKLTALGTARSSNSEYIGQGLTNPPYAQYVQANGGVNGHYAHHALTQDDNRWWQSTGQVSQSSKVWWEFEADDPMAIAAIRMQPCWGSYRAYISVHNGTRWLGKRKVPYTVTTGGVDIEAGIPFVKTVITDRNKDFDVVFARVYKNVKKIRITFGHLVSAGFSQYPWRAGLLDFKVYTGSAGSLGFHQGEVLKVVGNYSDYSQIVKWVCAWGGFYWPPQNTSRDFINLDATQPLTRVSYTWPDADLPKGRVWGDFMPSGTAGIADLTADMFDKKPLMDVINYVRDLLGFLFFIDETGGVVWRLPNLWELGNYVSPGEMHEAAAQHGTRIHGPLGRRRTLDMVTLDEEETLLSYTTVLNSDNIRERIFVGNTVGGFGTVIKGFNPYPVGLRRMAGWTDQHFRSNYEARVMADMISAQQMFSWKRGKAETPGYPAIQIDDQIRIFERVTNEQYYHYVMGITSTMDVNEGTWTYQLDTHWLGERPEDAWVVKVDQLDGVTKAYLNAVKRSEA